MEKRSESINFKDMDIELQKVKTAADFFGPGGLMQRMIKSTLELLLESELEEHLGYKKHEVKGNNTGNSRNGTTPKKVRSVAGDIEINSPRDRNGSFEPLIVQKHQKGVGGILDQHIISMYAKGMTARDISSHLQEVYGVEVSPTFISNTTEKVMESAREWQSRPLPPVYVFTYFDAIFYHVRENGKIVSKAAYICLGIDLEGKKDVLGIWVGESESTHFWMSIFSELQNRGVKDIIIACMDGLKGLAKAIKTVFPKTQVQLCIVHMIRNSMKYVGSKNKDAFLASLKKVYQAPSLAEAKAALQELNDQWMQLYPQAVLPWNNHWEYISTYFSFPAELRKVMYTTNAIESLNRQMRKVSKNRAILSNDNALFKLLYLAVQDVQKKWKFPIRDWGTIISQVATIYPDRF